MWAPQAVPLCHTGFGEVVTSSRSLRLVVYLVYLVYFHSDPISTTHSMTVCNLYVC